MPSQRVSADVAESLFSGAATVGDPGNAATISFNLKGFAELPLTVGASNETRVLETLTANNYPVGKLLNVYLQTTTGGTVSITGSQDGTVILTAAGDFAVFQVVPTSVSTKSWRVVSSPADSVSARGFETVTKSSVTDTATLTAAQVLTKWIEGTPTTTANYTLPIVTSLVSAIPGARVGDSFLLTVNSTPTAVGTISIFSSAGWTMVGDLTISPNQSRLFRVTLTSLTAAIFAAVSAAVRGSTSGRSIATRSTTSDITAAEVIGGTIISAPGGGITLTWPTGALMTAAFPAGFAVVGDSVDVVVTVTTAQTVTFAAGATGSTITGTSPAITGTTAGVSRVFRLTFTGAAAYTVS